MLTQGISKTYVSVAGVLFVLAARPVAWTVSMCFAGYGSLPAAGLPISAREYGKILLLSIASLALSSGFVFVYSVAATMVGVYFFGERPR